MNSIQTALITGFFDCFAKCTASACALVFMAGALSGGAAHKSQASALSAPVTAHDTAPRASASGLIAQTEETGTEKTVEDEAAEDEAAEDEAVEDEAVEDEATETERLMQLANDGDRDAALALAKRYVSGDEPDNDAAAKYAAIALADGGEKYASEFVPNTKAWSREFWRALQTQLQEKGAYRGAIDGLPGRGTQRAVNTYAGVEAPVVQPVRKKTTRRKKAPRGSRKN